MLWSLSSLDKNRTNVIIFIYKKYWNGVTLTIRLPYIKKVIVEAIKSTSISKNTNSISTHGSSWVPITTRPNSKVLHFCSITENIYTVSNAKN